MKQVLASTILLALHFPSTHGSVCGTSCATLQDAHDAIKLMITEDTDGSAYPIPSWDVLIAMEGVVTDMLSAAPCSCSSIFIPTILTDAGYELEEISDAGNQYCIFATTTTGNGNGSRAAYPWGSVIVNLSPTAQPLSIDIPHPRNDMSTSNQGIYVFRNANAKSYIVSGSERDTTNVAACGGAADQGSYFVADAAHNDQHGFHAAVLAVADYYALLGEDHTSIQFHGMGTTSCSGVDVYLTHGRSAVCPALGDDKISLLREEFNTASADAGLGGLVATLPGEEPTCNKSGTTNTQGRYLNGIPRADVCDTAFLDCDYSEKFIHIEQKKDPLRSDPAAYQIWANAINAWLGPTPTNPPPSCPPPAPTPSCTPGPSGNGQGCDPANCCGNGCEDFGKPADRVCLSGPSPPTSSPPPPAPTSSCLGKNSQCGGNGECCSGNCKGNSRCG